MHLLNEIKNNFLKLNPGSTMTLETETFLSNKNTADIKFFSKMESNRVQAFLYIMQCVILVLSFVKQWRSFVVYF